MRYICALSFVLAASIFSFAKCAFGTDAAPLETLQFTGEDHLIQTLIIVSDAESLRYNVIAACDAGVQGIDLIAGPTTIFIQPCGKKQTCRVNGSAPMAGLKTNVITAIAECADGVSQKESIRLNVGGKNPKVYLVASLPYFAGEAAPLIASGQSGEAVSTGTTTIRPQPDKGPELTVKSQKTSGNTYIVTTTASDADGLDFVEILREKVFLDVELCKGKTTCSLETRITESEQKSVKFQLKTMNLDGDLSFDEIVLTFDVGEKPQETEKEKDVEEKEKSPDSTSTKSP